ncbi:hypothetical protein PVAP13_7KG140620 [Panicum virgatum]|uniref:Uncharacterized protein n=1 Tax=Panicum virgatum TaxID=38727 RepID=A0A8T0QIQ6_PANVG|nr:hypothetical protein PVAP13_7KG140620 [Panicum virgatum]
MIVFTEDCDRDLKSKEAAASMARAGAVNKERDSLLKEGEMLKLREEFWAAEDLWMDGLVEGALDRWLEERNKMPNKKRKVVRVPVPDAYIHFIKENPTLMRELSDEEMAECPEHHRQLYVIQKLVNDKNRAYQKALIDQYNTFGFAYDEKEVTDDDDEKEVAVPKN